MVVVVTDLEIILNLKWNFTMSSKKRDSQKRRRETYFWMLVWHDRIIISWIPILNLCPFNLNLTSRMFYSPFSYLNTPLSNLNPPSNLKVLDFDSKCPRNSLICLHRLQLFPGLSGGEWVYGNLSKIQIKTDLQEWVV